MKANTCLFGEVNWLQVYFCHQPQLGCFYWWYTVCCGQEDWCNGGVARHALRACGVQAAATQAWEPGCIHIEGLQVYLSQGWLPVLFSLVDIFNVAQLGAKHGKASLWAATRSPFELYTRFESRADRQFRLLIYWSFDYKAWLVLDMCSLVWFT